MTVFVRRRPGRPAHHFERGGGIGAIAHTQYHIVARTPSRALAVLRCARSAASIIGDSVPHRWKGAWLVWAHYRCRGIMAARRVVTRVFPRLLLRRPIGICSCRCHSRKVKACSYALHIAPQYANYDAGIPDCILASLCPSRRHDSTDWRRLLIQPRLAKLFRIAILLCRALSLEAMMRAPDPASSISLRISPDRYWHCPASSIACAALQPPLDTSSQQCSDMSRRLHRRALMPARDFIKITCLGDKGAS